MIKSIFLNILLVFPFLSDLLQELYLIALPISYIEISFEDIYIWIYFYIYLHPLFKNQANSKTTILRPLTQQIYQLSQHRSNAKQLLVNLMATNQKEKIQTRQPTAVKNIPSASARSELLVFDLSLRYFYCKGVNVKIAWCWRRISYIVSSIFSPRYSWR